MLSLRSLAFILASAIRRARALSCAALDSVDKAIRGRKMATRMAVKMAINRAVSMSVPSEKCTPFKAQTRHPIAVQSKNTINADLGHCLKIQADTLQVNAFNFRSMEALR